MTHFNEKCIGIFNLTVFFAITALLKGTEDEHFKWYLSKNGPKTMTKLSLQVEKYINSEDAFK